MSEPVETKGKKFVAFLPKREYNVGVWSVECGVWSDGIAFGDGFEKQFAYPHFSLITPHA